MAAVEGHASSAEEEEEEVRKDPYAVVAAAHRYDDDVVEEAVTSDNPVLDQDTRSHVSMKGYVDDTVQTAGVLGEREHDDDAVF